MSSQSRPGVSWPSTGNVSGVATTHSKNNYNRKNPQTLQQYQEGRHNVLLSRTTEGPLANMMSRLSLGKGGKSRRHRHTRRRHRVRKTRKN